MKTRFFGILLAAVLVMTGCQAAKTARSAVTAAEHGADPAKATASTAHATPKLTAEEAQKIALKHAGFTADRVTALRTEYEIDYGIPHYDVEFHHGHWEYDYEIHADTGEILSYSKDD